MLQRTERVVSNATRQHARVISELNKLTKREQDVWERLAHGMTVREIAWMLKLSHKTIQHHVEGINRGLDIGGMVELRYHAVRWLYESVDAPVTVTEFEYVPQEKQC